MKSPTETHYHPQVWKADFLEPVKDQWDAIEKLSKSNQSHYSAVAILDSIMEHGFCEEIHPRMINQFFKEYAGAIHPTEYKNQDHEN